ncbi:MAG: hypothetical protein AAF412_13560, partial [Pseudomonadota bacterium]
LPRVLHFAEATDKWIKVCYWHLADIMTVLRLEQEDFFAMSAFGKSLCYIRTRSKRPLSPKKSHSLNTQQRAAVGTFRSI